MNQDILIKLLNHIYAIAPNYELVRKEVKNIIDQIQNSKQKYPHIEIVEPDKNEI
jgi:Na+/melibiose symporter-like transporter